jgi:hypothetical protein
MVKQISLHGEKEELFRSIHDEIEERHGYRPPATEVVGLLMAEWESEQTTGSFER